MVDLPSSLSGPVVSRVMTAFTIGHWLHCSMTLLAADAVGVCGNMVRILDIGAVATDTTSQWFHRGMAGSTIYRVGGVVCSGMVRSTDTSLVTTETICKVANVGVALGAVTGGCIQGVMMCVLLRHKGMTRRAITVGGYSLMTLVTQALRIKLALVVTG